VVLVVQPGSGDVLQFLKAGVMEIPDLIVVNKRDHPMAKTMLNEVRAVLTLDREREWKTPIVLTEAANGEGVEELWDAVERHRAYLEESGGLAARRSRNLGREVFAVASARAKRYLEVSVENDPELERLLDAVGRRELDPLTAVRDIMEKVFKIAENGSNPR
jgi:LAO/AO transport system kinase